MHYRRHGWHGHRGHRAPIIGILFVFFGTFWLLAKYYELKIKWEYAGPLALIILGVASVIRWWSWRRCMQYEEQGPPFPNVEPPRSP